MSGPSFIWHINLLSNLLSLSSASILPIYDKSPCFYAIRVIINLRLFNKISSSLDSISSLIILNPFFYKNMSLISSE
jgi:hypothetical protein